MEIKKHNLANSWILEAHSAYKVYSNEKSYIIVDEESDVVLGFTIDNTVLDVTRSSWNVCYKVRIDTRTITITTNPEEDEE
ncbi:hypothetical protein FQP34_22015 [Peribacillus simplex]|uniref:Uncharacterized protein n=1 Tax=Peribacillus simplex TaxID=1478 RepID=A0A8B5XU59_9BACI|nr:hypothetical protein [Peribacillus simplex]TVX77811.1 hypothetical protein FQP34_22015 [Peribacillus simplex]